MALVRCSWAAVGPLADYHDDEWGIPLTDEGRLFELLILEGCQAGLSWLQVLKRREGYRRAFLDFEVEKIAAFGEHDVERLMGDEGIIRNRAKINAAVKNARATLELWERGKSLREVLWSAVDHKPLQPNLRAGQGWPARTPESEKISKELTKLGFKFVGPVIIYALMQSAGLTNDHHVECFRHGPLSGLDIHE